MRCVRILAIMAFLVTVNAAASSPKAGASEIWDVTASCVHYQNRARFKSRTAEVEFVTVLADACAGAIATVGDPAAPDARKAAAERYLHRLHEARDAIAAIDGARLRATPRVTLGRARVRDLRASRGLVTITGEFLILRRAGVFAALEDWVAEGADFTLLAALR